MRIISGSARGTRLTTFSGGAIRPTPDRVREAIFSILTSRLGSLQGCRILDLFAGSGAMAIEALSRGGEHAWLVDQGSEAARVIPANLNACRLAERATLLRTTAAAGIARLTSERPFDLIFLDPPYHQDLVPQTLQTLSAAGLLAPAGTIVAEAGREDPVAESIGHLIRLEERHYGSVAVHLFIHPQPET